MPENRISPRRLIQRLRPVAFGAALVLAVAAYSTTGAGQQPAQHSYSARASAPLADISKGPYVADPAVIALLDRQDPGGDCGRSGPLVFGCLIQALAAAKTHQPPVGAFANPFNLRVAQDIRETIEQDLQGFQATGGIVPAQQIHPQFLTNSGSRIELVGLINRIDRQFIHDLIPGDEPRNRCGEISLIYRFSYSLRGGAVSSRLPVTFNVVLPAIPHDRKKGVTTCQGTAARWLAELNRPAGRTPEQVVADLTDAKKGIVALIDGRDIERIELNIQAYRISAGSDSTDLGSTAQYIIRVFRWHPARKMFTASYLTDQIDRARLLGNPLGDANSCDPGVNRPMSRDKFLAFLLSPVVLSDVDNGTLNIPQEFLACRATSSSPGGAARSGNALYWDALDPAEQLVTDDRIRTALARATSATRQFSFVRSPEDVRLRLNELSCSGCHQARAIAGFHFPGADRAETPVSNAVFLPGSPHFYGDQVRRIAILERLAAGHYLSRYQLAQSYASRPLNKFKPRMSDTQLIGGWGGACLLPEQRATSRRQWDCRAGLVCKALFDSLNAPGMGTCVPEGHQEIGDALQVGRVTSTRYGFETYLRTTPAPVGDWSDRLTRNTLIPTDLLPADAPADNSFYGAHQEFYQGDPTGGTGTPAEQARIKRDALTGGFPSGMLRLSECRGLPPESTCGLVASSGFNSCLEEVTAGTKTLGQCFEQRTSYAGMRACDVENPCRDDYICLRPMGYTLANGHQSFEARLAAVAGIYTAEDFGQKEPDPAWLSRNGGAGDQRGICIPPYFVFQFRSDGHPAPMTQTMGASLTP
ncbi:MAG TPA: hypothetical protein VGS22_24640 [Thermoanaerobaculia bacterium]|jgi:hypothetical protein|nr:hypothetical protein [Thermoanaerobaculia bacterium]